jgi:predicted nuclease of predicted toxin-antitoxin system
MPMRLLLDESLPHRLKTVFPGHQVNTVAEMGWKSLSNGELLARASGLFQVFLTADKKLQYQQNLVRFEIAVIVLNARQNRFVDYEPLIPQLLETLTRVQPGYVFRVASRPAR